MVTGIKRTFHTIGLKVALFSGVLSLFFVALIPALPVEAAQITARTLTISTSSPAASAATTTYTFTFTVPSATAVQSFQAQICTTASGTCTTPTGFANSSSTLGTITGFPGSWTVNTATAGSLRASTTTSTAPTNNITFTFNNVQNPTTANQTFYARMTTYSDNAWTNAIDTGTTAASTATQITVSASVPESLTFCTGTSGITSSSCAGATGSAVSLGTLLTSAPGSGTSQIGVTTNATSGYNVTVNGTTLTSGSNTIAALTSPTGSSAGSAQFGLNLRANTVPSVGSDPAGSGSAAPTTNYNTVNSYTFNNGDQIVSTVTPDNFRLFTVSYIANITSVTPPGTYSTTLTYICTAKY
ncbi:MAG TPA: hypothetical protein VLG11_05270 [Candidatus Saccharimonadales bacterium]|nr:hypothetical protein [Candidatus Saccharimonadales bacterium]